MYRVKSAESRWCVLTSRNRIIQGVVCAVIVVGAVSCGSVPQTNYYSLRLPPPPAAAQTPQSAAVLGIERFSAPDALHNDRLVFYSSPNQVGFYDYHRWVADPASMLRDDVARRIEQAGLFANVQLLPVRGESNYYLRGRVLHFEEVDYEGSVSGRAGLELTLVRGSDRQVLWSASRLAKSSAVGQGHAAVVEALNAASDQVLGELLPPLLAKAEEDLKQGAKKSP
jgi:ABC-type uncharacterized transport system auxiliary subunit